MPPKVIDIGRICLNLFHGGLLSRDNRQVLKTLVGWMVLRDHAKPGAQFHAAINMDKSVINAIAIVSTKQKFRVRHAHNF